MGVNCKEINVCGGNEASEIAKKIYKMCGNYIEIRKYMEFVMLKVYTVSLVMSSIEKESYAKV